VILDPGSVFPKFLTPGPGPGLREKRRLLPESTPAQDPVPPLVGVPTPSISPLMMVTAGRRCRAEVSRIRISGLESGWIQHIVNKPDRIRTTVLFKFPDQDQDFQISLFWDLTPTQS